MAKVPPSIRTRLDPISVALDIPSASLEMSPAAEAATSASCNLRRTGNVYVIQVKDEDPACEEHPDYNVVKTLTFSYDGSEQLRLAVLGRCDPNDAGRAVWSSYEPLAAREFKYDPMAGPRARYLVADYDPTADPDDPSQWTLLTPVGATEYNGVSPHGDPELKRVARSRAHLYGADAELTLVNGDWQWTNTVRYPWPGSQHTVSTGAQQYGHADLIGSNMLTSDANASAVSRVAYSAFGEVLTAAGAPGGAAPAGFPRYQYAGGYGYESGLLSAQGVNASLPPITLQHLGARWYQPDLGRFVQRDPIGIRGGINVYAYAMQSPMQLIDDLGASPRPIWSWTTFGEATGGGLVAGGVRGVFAGPGGALGGAGIGAAAGAGGYVGGYATGCIIADFDEITTDLGKASDIEDRNYKQRKEHPEIWPPKPPPPPLPPPHWPGPY